MIGVDTNVLVRTLVDDPQDPKQCSAARSLVARAGQVRVSGIVFIETLWVLQRSYRATRGEVARIAGDLLGHPRYEIENAHQLRNALVIYRGSNVDFADAVALADVRERGLTLHTFDRRLAKLDSAALVAPGS